MAFMRLSIIMEAVLVGVIEEIVAEVDLEANDAEEAALVVDHAVDLVVVVEVDIELEDEATRRSNVTTTIL
jgi:hypothetical protein